METCMYSELKELCMFNDQDQNPDIQAPIQVYVFFLIDSLYKKNELFGWF